MVQAKYIVSDKAVDVGRRVFITSFMMDEGFKRGVARNIGEEKVEVLIDLEDRNPNGFRNQLEEAIHTKFKSTELKCKPEKIKIELAETNNPGWEIPKLMFSSQSLLLNQTGKGVNVMIQVRDAITKGFDELPEKIARAIKGN